MLRQQRMRLPLIKPLRQRHLDSEPRETAELRQLDKAHLWHPFTQMRDWCAPDHDPLVIVAGEGPWLHDSEGHRYLDGNSSIWTNIHGHRHPRLDAALAEQASRLAHCSALGFTNGPAILLAEKLVSWIPERRLPRVFFSDNGSTAVECACKMAIQYRQLQGEPGRTSFLSFEGGYHGDTAGAASLGGIGTFHDRFRGTGFEVRVLSEIGQLDTMGREAISGITAVVIEPLIQGAAGMRRWPPGMLRQLGDWCREHDVLLIFDEVMTGFGRTGTRFAGEQEGVVPDFLCLAKGLTGGYMPLAATLTTERVFEAFLGGPDRTFYYGHSYCGNPLGCSVALANLEVFEEELTLESLGPKIERFHESLDAYFGSHDSVLEVRRIGLIAGIEIGPFPAEARMGARVCLAARRHGLLTRPILDTLVLMPPLCSTGDQIESMVAALAAGLEDCRLR